MALWVHGFLIMKIPSKREIQNIAIDHSSAINYKDFRHND